MAASLKQLLAVSVLLSAAEKATEAGVLTQADDDTMRAAIEHVRVAFMTFNKSFRNFGAERRAANRLTDNY
jgi:hypothetical protein